VLFDRFSAFLYTRYITKSDVLVAHDLTVLETYYSTSPIKEIGRLKMVQTSTIWVKDSCKIHS
jgi:hypothetical protein